MIRRSATAIVKNRPRLLELRGRFLCGSSSRGILGADDSSSSRSSCCSPSSGRHCITKSGCESFMVGDCHLTSGSLAENGCYRPYLRTRDPPGRGVQQQLQSEWLGIAGSSGALDDGSVMHARTLLHTDSAGWVVSSRSNQLVGYLGGQCSSFRRWSSRKVGINTSQSRWQLEPQRSISIRVLSTKANVEDGSDGSKEKAAHLDEQSRPKTPNDFKHEDIEGPTVDKDLSDTANELRQSVGELSTFMNKLSKGFLLLGSLQLGSAILSSYLGAWPMVSLSHGLQFVMSFILAYLFRHFGSAVEFFTKIEERSRLRVLTLSLQVVKALASLFYRSNFVVQVVCFGTLIVLIGDIYHSL